MEGASQENLEKTQQDLKAGAAIFLQRKLISKWGKNEGANQKTYKENWVNLYADRFRRIIEENPKLIEKYLQSPEETENEAETLLYEKETIH